MTKRSFEVKKARKANRIRKTENNTENIKEKALDIRKTRLSIKIKEF